VGSGGRKLRWGAKGRGKRGGVRLIYYWAMCQERELQPGEACFAEHEGSFGEFRYVKVRATGPGRNDLRGALHALVAAQYGEGEVVRFVVDFR
jgi:hypothetical protein